jgi:hypothetical protein
MAVTNQHLSYSRCTAKNVVRTIEEHFQNGAVIISFTVLTRQAASMSVMDSSNHVTIQLLSLED